MIVCIAAQRMVMTVEQRNCGVVVSTSGQELVFESVRGAAARSRPTDKDAARLLSRFAAASEEGPEQFGMEPREPSATFLELCERLGLRCIDRPFGREAWRVTVSLSAGPP